MYSNSGDVDVDWDWNSDWNSDTNSGRKIRGRGAVDQSIFISSREALVE